VTLFLVAALGIAGTLLVRRTGDEVEYLNDLRFRSGAALRRVSGTPWFLVAKLDRQEVYAPIQRRGKLWLLAVLGLIAAAGAGAWALWRQQQLGFYRERLEAGEHRRQLEQQLAESQKIEGLGRLAGGVAHDFNNHLTVINGYCDLLLARGGASGRVRDAVAQIRHAGQQAAALTRQLLAFGQRQILSPRPLNLNTLVEEERLLLEQAIGNDIKLVIVPGPHLGLVTADPGQMNQVLMNLVLNARDAMPGGGRIVMETSNVELDKSYAISHPEVVPGPYVMLAVTDTGVGMDRETVSRVFEPFFNTRKQGAGTGLGLASVHGIVRQSGGWIWVYSEPDQGTSFRVYFPRATDAVEVPPTPPLPPAAAGTETVLVVEDQPHVRRLTATVLKQFGYGVLEAAAGPEALECSAKFSGPIHLLVTDVVMPGMTGPELACQLSAIRPEMKVLYTSAYTANVVAHEGVLDPGMAFLQKPFSPDGLARKVRETLGDARRPCTILVADDDAAVRGLLRQVLEDAGYEVLEAAHGRAAVELVRSVHVDVLITDLVMPEQEGLETLSQVRQSHPGIGVIAISGAFGGDFLKTAKLLGATATLCKPIPPEDLLAAVRQVLGG
jgi:signal transduction histidine kinase/CheY-like chemotaxis protein